MSEDAERSTDSAVRIVGRPFPKGTSGCPGGRSRASYDFSAEARKHAPEYLQVLLRSLKSRSWRERHSAVSLLMDRAFGKAPMTINGMDGASLTVLHLTATIEAGEKILAELARQQNPIIDGQSDAVIEAPAAVGDLSIPARE